MAVLRLDPDQIVKGGSEVQRALDWAKSHLGNSPILIASSSTPDQVSALQSRYGRDVAGHAIEQAMANISEGLMSEGVRRLIVAGGETSGAVVDRLDIPAFLVGPEIATGVPRAADHREQRRRHDHGAEVRKLWWPGLLQ